MLAPLDLNLVPLDRLTSIPPFNRESLSSQVESDHAEIAFRIFDRCVINAWNISNPAHHHYFKSTPTFPHAPFHNTHLYVEKPLENGVICPDLCDKISRQIQWISGQFFKEDVSIQVIIEGYQEFYKALAEKIRDQGNPDVEVFSLLNDTSKQIGPNKNVTGILIDRKQFTIEDRGIMIESYKEEANGRDCEFVLPYVRVQELLTKQSLVIAGVHVAGADNCYPVSGLAVLNKHMHALHGKYQGQCDIVAIGDFNAPSMHVKTSLVGMEILMPSYPTHVNPRSEASVYDQAAVLKGSHPVVYETYSVKLSPSSTGLVDSIISSHLRQSVKQVEAQLQIMV